MDEANARTSWSWSRFFSYRSWLPWLCGFVAGMVASLISKAVGFQYHSEATMIVFWLVAVPVNAYYDGSLKSRPFRVVAFAIVVAAISATLTHIA